MDTDRDDNTAKGCGTLLVVALVLLFMLGSCAKDAWDDRQRDNRTQSEGGGTVLVEAPKRTCWYLTAHDERLPEGAPGGETEDELSLSEREELEEAGGAYEQEGCGPAEVSLPGEFIFGSVSVFVGDDDDRHNYAAWLWLTSKLMPRGGAVSVDGYDHDNDTAVFAAAPNKVYDSDSWAAGVISEEPFGPASATALDADTRARLRKADLDTDVFASDRSAAAAELMSGKPVSIGDARTALRRVAAPVAAALDTDYLAYLASGTYTPEEIWKGKPPASVLKVLADMENAGVSVSAQVPAIRKWLADRFLAEIRPAYDASSNYSSAAKAVTALGSVDPSRKSRWNSLAARWSTTAQSLKAAEQAEEAREQAELDALLDAPPSSGWYAGCDGDGDGICNE